MDALYEIPLAFSQFMRNLEATDGEITKEKIDELNLLIGSFDEAVDCMERSIQNAHARVQMIDAEIERLKGIRAAEGVALESMENRLVKSMSIMDDGSPQWHGVVFRVKTARTAPYVLVENDASVPDDYCDYRVQGKFTRVAAEKAAAAIARKGEAATIERSVSKVRIAESLKQGTPVDGCRLESGKLRIMRK